MPWFIHRKEILQATLEAIPGAITVADMQDPGHPLICVNQAFLDMTGYTREECLGRNCRFLQGPGTEPEAIQKLRQAISGCHSVSLTLTNYRKDGSRFRNALKLSPVFDAEGGNCVAFIGLQEDVTEQEEQQIRLAQEHKFAALGEMISGVAHEINNLLQPVLLLTDLLRTDDRLTEHQDLKSHLQTISDSAGSAREIVKDILLYAGNKEALPAQPSVFADSLNRAVNLNKKLIPSNIRFQTEFDDDLDGNALLGATQLTQILANLVKNAIDAMPGTGKLTLAARRKIVSCPPLPQMTRGKRYFILTFTDTGKGIPPDIAGRIFDPFFTTKSLAEGTGLGLAVVYSLLRHIDGGITVSSVPGQGTTFTLYIPAILTEEEETLWQESC